MIVKRWGYFGVLGLVLTTILFRHLPSHWLCSILASLAYTASFFFLMPAITIAFGSFFLKFRERDWLLDQLQLEGDETVLDAGCGRGLLLIGAAKRLSTGKAHGLDMWAQEDQSSNCRKATRANAAIEGVAGKIEVHDGDMRRMPFEDARFDAVVSSWAIHNIYDARERERALREILRVLKPGGKLAILDIDHAQEYRDFYVQAGLKEVRLLGPRYTFGKKTYLLMARNLSTKTSREVL